MFFIIITKSRSVHTTIELIIAYRITYIGLYSIVFVRFTAALKRQFAGCSFACPKGAVGDKYFAAGSINKILRVPVIRLYLNACDFVTARLRMFTGRRKPAEI